MKAPPGVSTENSTGSNKRRFSSGSSPDSLSPKRPKLPGLLAAVTAASSAANDDTNPKGVTNLMRNR